MPDNGPVTSTLETKIDDLYSGPLGEFVSRRDALAKTLSGDDAKRVKKLTKPTVVPWAINQLYWRARPVYERVIKSGQTLRDAQVAALGGRKADIRDATDAHRKAIAEAVKEAERIAASDGSHPLPDALMRTLEAISLAPQDGEAPGRLTKPLRPSGFEALAGVKIAETAKVTSSTSHVESRRAKALAAKEEAERKKREAEIRKAEAKLERARKKMAEAEAALRRVRT